MTCDTCKVECKRFAVNRNGTLRFRCPKCRKTLSETRKSLVGSMTVPTEKVLAILNLFIEGTSVRSTERLTCVHRDTILKVLVAAGERCEKLMGRLIVNVPVKDVECDEIWGFIQKKEGHKGPEEAHNNSIGDAYCFVAIERNTKLVLNFALGRRDTATTQIFVTGKSSSITGKAPGGMDRQFTAIMGPEASRFYFLGSASHKGGPRLRQGQRLHLCGPLSLHPDEHRNSHAADVARRETQGVADLLGVLFRLVCRAYGFA